jgi:hypothetical protein
MNQLETTNKSYTLKGLKMVTIFYFIMFISSIFLIIGQYYYDMWEIAATAALLILISLLMIYLGIRDIKKGNKEFGEKHEKSTQKASNFIFWGIIAILIGTFFIRPFSVYSPIFYAILTAALYIPFWLALVYLIKEISSDMVKKLLWIAFFSRFILVAFINFYSETYVDKHEEIPILFAIFQLISIIPSLIFIYCYYDTYNKIRNKQILAV